MNFLTTNHQMVVDFLRAFFSNVRVSLCGFRTFVTQKFLNKA